MKRILLGALLASTAMSAQAADLAARPYTKAPVMAAVYDWTGFYVGVNAGVGLGRNRTSQDFGGLANTSTYVSPFGGLGGAQIGYNWQTNGSFLGPIVFGIEADIQGADMSDGYPNLGGLAQYNQKLDWFGTVRGRVGLATGPVLSYVTAGYAYGNVNTTVTEGGVASPQLSGGRSGWTWGSGVEAAIGGNWTAKIEYLWLDLGDRTDGLAFAVPPGQSLHSEFRENIFRVGLNYRIGGNSAYTPIAAANWSGLYLGGNIGSGTGRDRSSLVAGGGAPALLNTSPDGINGGVQAGYNWQAGNWVYGLETDFQASAQEDNKTFAIAPGTALNINSKLPWFGTVRGRLGYSIGSSLFYGTGGFAYGDVKTGINTASVSQTQTGWTVGGGIETPFTFLGLFGPNWTSKTEYLYVDLGRSTNDFGAPGVFSTDVKEHILRTGLNYHFNTPVVARY
jgi:outer membrane immunogenic protein